MEGLTIILRQSLTMKQACGSYLESTVIQTYNLNRRRELIITRLVHPSLRVPKMTSKHQQETSMGLKTR